VLAPRGLHSKSKTETKKRADPFEKKKEKTPNGGNLRFAGVQSQRDKSSGPRLEAELQPESGNYDPKKRAARPGVMVAKKRSNQKKRNYTSVTWFKREGERDQRG